MSVLHNRISNQELKQQLWEEKEPRTTLSFYHYFKIDDPQNFRDELFKTLTELKIFGRIYVAEEGINAQISVPVSHFDEFRNYIYSIHPLDGVRLNVAVHDDARLNDPVGQGKSFWVLKIKVRKKIVADGISDPSFNMYKKGKYVNALQMNELMKDPDTVVIDMRNHYEYEVGHFKNAWEIPSDTFRQQLPMAVEMMRNKKDKNIIMYCTGGIRCEKASAYMLHNGFNHVFHLEGGIIHYAKEVKELKLQSKFIGKNFVFDERLGEKITEDVIAKCHQCGKPADTHVNCANEGCHLLFIQCDECRKKYEGCCSETCREFIHLPAEQQKQLRKGIDKGRNIFNKSKLRLRPLIKQRDNEDIF
jgi:UPF0176 protein